MKRRPWRVLSTGTIRTRTYAVRTVA
jgi:hypothetical protein